MDMPRLTALVAMGAGQDGAAIEANALALALSLARRRLDGPSGEAAGHRFADALRSPCDHARNMAEAGAPVETVSKRDSI